MTHINDKTRRADIYLGQIMLTSLGRLWLFTREHCVIVFETALNNMTLG